MSFAQEVRDFLTGYKTVREMGQTDEKGKRDQQKLEDDKAYQDALLDLRGQELDLQRQRLSQSAADSGRAAGEAAIRMQRADQKWQWELEDRERQNAERAAATEAARSQQRVEAAIPFGEAPPGWNGGGAFDPFAGVLPPAPGEKPAGAFQGGGMVGRGRSGVGLHNAVLDATTPPAMEAPRAPQSPNTAPPPPAALPSQVTPPPSPPPAVPAATALPQPNMPAQQPAPPAASPEASWNDVNPDSMRMVISRTQEAAAAGLSELEKSFKVPRSALDTRAAGAQAQDPLAPEMTLEELDQMKNAVDPNGEIPAFLRTGAAIAEAYTYFRENGEPEKAANAAKHMILAERRASQTLGALAVNAMQSGNTAEACKLFNDACNRFPSAHEIRVVPDEQGILTYTVRENGETLEQGRLEARQFLEVAGTVADGSLFMNSLVHFVESTKQPEQARPSQALTLYGDAQAAALRARQAYEDSAIGGREGDPELRALAEEAAAGALQAQQRALDLGQSMTDLRRAVEESSGRGPAAATGAQATPQGNEPPVGTVMDGWRYKGGGAADQRNWERVGG